ncbi:MAG: Amidohydrolase family protein [Acidobacteria bacterium]|nr:Amidohydrolase family protein [Acidobacteriota bacterium]
MTNTTRIALLVTLAAVARPSAQSTGPSPLAADADRLAAAVQPKVVSWRRDFHQHPELGNQEVRTAGIVAQHLKALGFEVQTNVAHTGVVGVLRGAKPGKVVALRADMDGLPVTEEVDLPFASKVRATWNGEEVGVMHACGHDNHVAILMGVAEVLAGLKDRLPGTVKLLFQPAEEGGPQIGEVAGAELMIKEGAFDNPKPDAVFGLHVFPFPVGTVAYRSGGAMASTDDLRIVIRGAQTHGAMPWRGIDPIVVASQVILGLQTVVSRQIDVTLTPSIVTVGLIRGGVRANIIPDQVEMAGTIRTFDEGTRDEIHRRVQRTAEAIASAAGATAQVTINRNYPVTYNDPALTDRMLPTLKRAAGAEHVVAVPPTTTAEDFSYFAQKAPGLFLFLGVTPSSQDPATAAPNHSPRFFADEGALPVGVRTLTHLTLDFLAQP